MGRLLPGSSSLVIVTMSLAAGLAVSSARISGAQAPSAAGKTVWDGAYTEAQAKRGESVYVKECASCHGDDLTGQQSRLMGDRFMRDWREDNLNNLFRRIRAVMPRRTPGILTDSQYLDVVAYILQQNEFPAGTQELSGEVAPTIQLVGKEGPQPVPEFALIQITGCLKESAGSWTLASATDPGRSRTPDLTPEDVQAAVAKPLGAGTFRLLETLPYKPETIKDHKVMVKGLLIRRPDNRINVTALQTVAPNCSPD